MDYSITINNHKYKIAFSLFLAYLCLSLYRIGNNSLWYDECFSIDWANDSIKDIIDYSLTQDINPPLYLIILHYWMQVFGESEIALRSVSAVAMSLASGVFFLFCQRFFNWQTAIFSALLFLSSNELYYYSQEGRTYGLIILFSTLSYYAFLSFISSPNWKNAVFLGIFNICIFYLHTLGSFLFIGQIILAPILTFNKHIFTNKEDKSVLFLGYSKKHFFYYLLSWLTFIVLFLPWKSRLIELLTKKQTVVWSSKPTIKEFKQLLFDFHNSENLFYTYILTFSIVLIVISIFKKVRHESFKLKTLIIPLILGPLLLYLNYTLAVNITPIFVKRYVLFTILGFILSYAYIFSILKIDFRIKLLLFSILIAFTVLKMNVPKPSTWDFREGVELVMKNKNETSFVTTDIPMLFSYYVDRDVIFKAQVGIWRDKLLNKHGIYTSYDLDWPKTTDFSRFTDIYYTNSFGSYSDPTKIVESLLKEKFILVKDTNFNGMYIAHYINPTISPEILTDLKKKIVENKEWYDQVILKAKERNIPIDSMITADAIWFYQTNMLPKKSKNNF